MKFFPTSEDLTFGQQLRRWLRQRGRRDNIKERAIAWPGLTVICPDPLCKAKIGTFTGYIYPGDPILSKLVDPEPDQHIAPGVQTKCAKCGSAYIRQIGAHRMVHTAQGWR